MKIDNISVIGLGYIGLPLAVILASKSKPVSGYDKNSYVLNDIKKSNVKINEPDFLKLLNSQKVKKKFKISKKLKKSDVFIIAVPTPIKKFNSKVNMSAIFNVINNIIKILTPGNLIIIESTCPVGTTNLIEKFIYKKRSDLKKNSINISYCPERILPGNTIKELESNDRIIGGVNYKSSLHAKKVYELFVKGKLHLTDSKTAEMCKLSENVFRDINIAYANELSMIADKNNVDIWSLIKLTNFHPRVKILNPGPGVGGHCIAVDPWFIINQNKRYSKLILQARKTNLIKEKWVIKRIKEKIKILLKNNNTLNVVFFGLTYKANSNDIRESPSINIIKKFLNIKKINIYVCEPNVKNMKFNSKVKFVKLDVAIKKLGLGVLLVKHKEFQTRYFKNFGVDNIIDTCGILSQ